MKGSQALEKCDFVERAGWHTVIAQLDPLGSPVKFLVRGGGKRLREELFHIQLCCGKPRVQRVICIFCIAILKR